MRGDHAGWRRVVEMIRDEVTRIVGDDQSHGMTHALNTMRLAVRIGRVEGGDLSVIEAAALLHDIGRVNPFSDPEHGRRGAVLAREILDKLDAPTNRELVCEIIARHDDPDDGRGGPTELIVVKDADKLELMRISPGHLDLDRLTTVEALRQVPYALSLQYRYTLNRPDVAVVIRRAEERLKQKQES